MSAEGSPGGRDTPSSVGREGPLAGRVAPPRVRIALKLLAGVGLIVMLLLFAGTEVDFVYAGF